MPDHARAGHDAANPLAGARAVDVTALAQAWIAPVLRPGATVLDATAGGGRDTLFLARGSAPGGTVHAFDIQAAAIERARAYVAGARPAAEVHWHPVCHSSVGQRIAPGALAAAMFNLGWLPGGDRGVVTRPETTVAALEACRTLLRHGGRITIVCYRGHPGGAREAAAVAAWIGRGPLRVRLQRAASASPHAPVLHVLERYRARTPGKACARAGDGRPRPARGAKA